LAAPTPRQLLIEAVVSVDHPLQRELRLDEPARRLPHAPGSRRIGDEAQHRVRQRVRLIGRDDVTSLAVPDELRVAARVGDDHR
jgi:hypothetical protein